ncbi:DUF6961 family protein [Sphingobium yanoikuyae]
MELDCRTFWAVAQKVVNAHGVDAPRFAARQIEFSAKAGDMSSLKAWNSIADRIDQLMAGKVAPYEGCWNASAISRGWGGA